MKRVLSGMSVLVLIFLAACNALSAGQGGQPQVAGEPTLSPAQAETQVANMLTLMPPATAIPAQNATATPMLPTLVIQTATSAPAEADQPTQAPTATTDTAAQPAAPTATQAATVSGATVTVAAPAQATATSGPAPTATVPAGPTFTPSANDPRGRLGNPTSTDPMNDEFTWVWPTGTDKFTTGSFGGGVQTVTALTGTDGWRLANPAGRAFTNLYLEATIRTNTCSGSDHYGLILRVPVPKDSDQGYLFGATCDGKYSLRRWNSKIGTKGEMKWLVNWTASPAIATGSNQINRLGIYTVGGRLILYANGKLLTEAQDATFATGYFGVMIGSDNTLPMSIRVDEMSYWENAQP